MAAMPPSQAGRRASRARSRASKPAVSLSLAPLRWHSEAVAVHTLAATANRMALSISLPLRLAGPRRLRLLRTPPAGLHCVVSCYDDSGTAASSARTAVSSLARQAQSDVPSAGPARVRGSVLLRFRPRLTRPGPQGLDERSGDGHLAVFFR